MWENNPQLNEIAFSGEIPHENAENSVSELPDLKFSGRRGGWGGSMPPGPPQLLPCLYQKSRYGPAYALHVQNSSFIVPSCLLAVSSL